MTSTQRLIKIADVMKDDNIDVISKTIVIENILIDGKYLPKDFRKEVVK